MSSTLCRKRGRHADLRGHVRYVVVLLLLAVATACGSNSSSSSVGTAEFGTPAASNTPSLNETSLDNPSELLWELTKIVVSGIVSIAWIILRSLLCLATGGWLGILVLVAAFLSAAICYLQYHSLRYDWPRALAIGAMASLPVLVLRILC